MLFTERREPDLFVAARRKVTFKCRPTPRLSAVCPFAALCYVNANVPPDNVTTPRNEEMPLSGKSDWPDSVWENSS